MTKRRIWFHYKLYRLYISNRYRNRDLFVYLFFVCYCKCVWWVMGFYTWGILMIRLLRARHKVNGSIIVYMNSENAYLWRLAVFVIYSTKIMRAIIQMTRVGMENYWAIIGIRRWSTNPWTVWSWYFCLGDTKLHRTMAAYLSKYILI